METQSTANTQSTPNEAKKKPEFSFPFQPYSIQTDFMTNLYLTLDKKNVGVFESPTGTGKSLSIICSSLQWLRDNETKPLATDTNNSTTTSTTNTTESTPKKELPQWMIEYKKSKDAERQQVLEQEQAEKISKQRNRLKRVRESEYVWSVQKMRKMNDGTKKKDNKDPDQDDSKHLLDDYESEEDESNKLEELDKKGLKALYGIMDSDDEDEKDLKLNPENEEEKNNFEVRKIYYCSRTHSQLTQFVNEVKRTKFFEDIKLVNLGSRKNLCINAQVKFLPTVNQINDACLDMMKSNSLKDIRRDKKQAQLLEKQPARESRCDYYNPDQQIIFRDKILAQAKDIEELGALGKQLHTCPYYASRSAIKTAELVILPYQMILHKETREALDITLKDNIVIFDEAHNLIETINNIYSVEIDVTKISQAHAQLTQYLERYLKRLKPKNISYIEKLLFILKSFLKYLEPKKTTNGSNADDTKDNNKPQFQQPSSAIHNLNDFLFETGIDNMNMFKIEKYIKRSEIVKKVNGFCESYQVEVKNHTQDTVIKVQLASEDFSVHRPALGMIESFLLALTNNVQDGRILITRQSDWKKSTMKFLLLNPELHFQDIVQQARAVILAGGTMQPITDFTQQLFGGKVPQERLTTFSCSHIIPDENLVALIMDKGPNDINLNFTYANRNDQKTLEELGLVLINICTVVPDGVVVFFPSYSFEEQVHTVWRQLGIDKRIEAKKKIFREPRQANKVEDTLRAYAECIENNFPEFDQYHNLINKPKGALLSCVVGGKMSEGINFSDGLGRCVVVIGLPYPNSTDPVLKEKMSYINQKAQEINTKESVKLITGNEYYENLCMKAVNQSIGRSIRHARDYASIVMIDQRYTRSNIVNKLPKWISSRLVRPDSHTDFNSNFENITRFFESKEKNQLDIEGKRRTLHMQQM